jgi:peptidoglycan/LPS O-acetylase OafA/YrhL
MSLSSTSQLSTIQALRGLAALGVTLLHLSGLQMLEGLRADTGIFAYGWIGVDLFFIISGFIMVWVTQNISSTPTTAIRFMTSRIVRIYPLWWVCVSILALFFFIIHGVPASVDVVPKNEAWIYYLKSLILWPQQLAPLLDVGWTLIHEMFFYFVFALIIALGMRRKLLLGLAIWSALTFLGGMLNLGELNPFFKIFFSPLSFLFIAGALIGKGAIVAKFVKSAWLLLFLSLAIVLSLIVFEVLDRRERVIQLIIPLSMLLWSVVTLEQARKIRVLSTLKLLGHISYALYLTHPLVIIFWRVVRPFYEGGLFQDYTKFLSNGFVICIDMIVLIMACLMVAFLFHALIERPALRLAKRKLQSYRTASQ